MGSWQIQRSAPHTGDGRGSAQSRAGIHDQATLTVALAGAS
jgi:hypothetical protein